jgi:hypothetical protein
MRHRQSSEMAAGRTDCDLLKTLNLFTKFSWTATWRSGYAAVCKTDVFASRFNGHSEN